MSGAEDDRTYAVVLNDEEQYSVWFADSDPPAGWRLHGFAGSKSECLNHIAEVWTDMRPRSVRDWAGNGYEALAS
jgi:MbtH protein